MWSERSLWDWYHTERQVPEVLIFLKAANEGSMRRFTLFLVALLLPLLAVRSMADDYKVNIPAASRGAFRSAASNQAAQALARVRGDARYI